MTKRTNKRQRRIKEQGINLAAAQIYELLQEVELERLREWIEEDAGNYARLLSVLVRVSEGALKYERYRAEVAETRRKLQEHFRKAQQNGLTNEAVREMEEALRLL